MAPDNLPAFADSQGQILGPAVQWLGQAVSGSLPALLCVIGIALVGLLSLQGRLPFRQGVRVVIGSFVLFGAPFVAAALLDLASNPPASLPPPGPPLPTGTRSLPPAGYDPYAGASLRRD